MKENKIKILQRGEVDITLMGIYKPCDTLLIQAMKFTTLYSAMNIINWARKYDVSIEVNTNDDLLIHTLEGRMIASKGDYIIKGIEDEFYPCKASVFDKKYIKTNVL